MNQKTFSIIGADDEAVIYLESGGDPCFGKSFVKSNPNCMACRAPCVMDGKVVLLKDICAMRFSKQPKVAKLKRLTSKDVMDRIEQGKTIPEIFREILNNAPPEQLGAAARELLLDRVVYLRSLGWTIEVPRYKEMLDV